MQIKHDRTMVYHVLGVLQNHGLNPQKDKTLYKNIIKLGPIIKIIPQGYREKFLLQNQRA